MPQQIEMGFYDQHLLSGEIRLGASQTPAEHLVPDLISIIDSDFPEIRISLGVKSTKGVIEGVLDYKYDLGLLKDAAMTTASIKRYGVAIT